MGVTTLALVKNDSSQSPADLCAVMCASDEMFLLLRLITPFLSW